MIFILPLTPILIAVFLLAAALLTEVATVIDTIITIAWILVIICSIFILVCNIIRKVSTIHKIVGTIICVASTVITLIESKTFLFGLADSSESGVIEFGFVLIFGGCIWLASIAMSVGASAMAIDAGESLQNVNYLKAIGYLAGSLVLAGVFGLLG